VCVCVCVSYDTFLPVTEHICESWYNHVPEGDGKGVRVQVSCRAWASVPSPDLCTLDPEACTGADGCVRMENVVGACRSEHISASMTLCLCKMCAPAELL
jgi:hypothetical protein